MADLEQINWFRYLSFSSRYLFLEFVLLAIYFDEI